MEGSVCACVLQSFSKFVVFNLKSFWQPRPLQQRCLVLPQTPARLRRFTWPEQLSHSCEHTKLKKHPISIYFFLDKQFYFR